MNKNTHPPKEIFEGFDFPNTTPVPDIVFDELLSLLTGNELKVLLYIIRRTYGFGKNADAISLSQFRKGITTQDKKILDKGCGIEHNRTILVALESLEKKGFVIAKKRHTNAGDSDTTVYKLRFKKSREEATEEVSSQEVVTSSNHVVTSGNEGGYSTSPGWLPQVTTVVTSSNQQETVLQYTELQETVIQEGTYSADLHSQDQRVPHPFHDFIFLNDSLAPSEMIVLLTFQQYSSEIEDKRRASIAEEVKADLARRGYTVSYRWEHEAEPTFTPAVVDAHHQGSEHSPEIVHAPSFSTDRSADDTPRSSGESHDVTLTGELTWGYVLTQPLTVQVVYDDGEYVVSESRYANHAAASTEAEAIAAFKRTLVDECFWLSKEESALAPHLLEELAYLRSLIAHQDSGFLPSPESASASSVQNTSIGVPTTTQATLAPSQRQNEASSTNGTEASELRIAGDTPNDTPNNVTPDQEKPPRPERPVMPPAEMKWNAEKLVQITEAKRFVRGKQGVYFDETVRGSGAKSQRQRQLDAAKAIIARKITEAQYLAAYDETNNEWWNKKGSVTVELMAANTPRKIMRVVEITEELESRSETVPVNGKTTSRLGSSQTLVRPNKTAYTEDELKLLRRMTTEQRKEWMAQRRQAQAVG